MTSLKARLIVAATIWIALGMIVAGFVQAAVFKRHVTEQFHEELYVHLDELQRLTDTSSGSAPHLVRSLSDPRYDVKLSGYYWEIQKDGAVLARSASLDGPGLKTPADAPSDIGVHTHVISGPTGALIVAERAVWQSPKDRPMWFIIGTDQRHLDTVLASFNSTLSAALAAFGLTLVAAAALLIAYALKPLQQLRLALTNVHAGQTKRLDGQFPDEVVPLVDDLNKLFGSTSELIQRARTQAGNMAHGLKTPLAILTDEAYRLGEQGQLETSATILTQCRSMQTHIDYQIARARAVAMRASPGIIANARNAASDVASALGRLYADKNIVIDIDVPSDLLLACDPADLNEMLGNLVDNACKHAKSKVHISAAKEAAGLVVDDDGPGLPPEALEVVFNVGERWDSRKAGSGLGLAIVRDLAQLYGGDVKLGISQLGGLSASLLIEMVKSKPG